MQIKTCNTPEVVDLNSKLFFTRIFASCDLNKSVKVCN